tara:strand:+ start:1552 stop:2157 length:606 start_codon:yes stop_codon:yes gene_type:complete
MPITLNGDGTVTGVSVGGLPDGIVDTDMLAANAVSSAKLASGAGGKILQVKSATKTNTASTSSATYSDISDLTVTLTTPQSGSKVLVSCDLMIGSVDNNYAGFKLFRDSTALSVSTQATGNQSNTTFGVGLRADFHFRTQSVGYQFLDTHGADGSTNVTYKLQWAGLYLSQAVYINRPQQTDNDTYTLYGTSTITAMEVAA